MRWCAELASVREKRADGEAADDGASLHAQRARAIAFDLEMAHASLAEERSKLKLLGVDVAIFGVNQPRPDDEDVTELVWDDRLDGVYRKLILNGT